MKVYLALVRDIGQIDQLDEIRIPCGWESLLQGMRVQFCIIDCNCGLRQTIQNGRSRFTGNNVWKIKLKGKC